MRQKASGLSGVAAGLFVIAILLVGTFIVFRSVLPSLQFPSTAQSISSSTTESSTNSGDSQTSTAKTTTQKGAVIADPSFSNGNATITYPSDYNQLVEYQLSLINQDRAKFGQPSVTLSPIKSGQQHADSMLFFDYFNHWDLQGYKPYVRYTLLNGRGGMEENVAYEYTGTPYYLTTDLVKSALSSLEYQMMYNDSACCQNGHHTNILDGLHNRVSIGIEHDLSHVYLVQDFENYYINFSQPLLSNGNLIRLVGNLSTPLTDAQVLVFYDTYPAPLNKTQLKLPPYSGAYDQGTFVGGVVPPCTLACASYSPHLTILAAAWTLSPGRIDIEFKLTDFQKHGRGVYTIYLEKSESQNPEILFNFSVFENGLKTTS